MSSSRRRRRSLLFIHHSCGGQLLAAPGPAIERAPCIYASHPNGGGLRAGLEARGYDVHEASYGSEVGGDTDLFHWKVKFATQMARVLTTDGDDRLLPGGQRHDVVLFKSCFPNSRFTGEGTAPGDPSGPELSLWNAKAAMSAVLEELAKQPDTLFVYLTAPPEVRPGGGPLLKALAKRALGRSPSAAVARRRGRLARAFNRWIVSEGGWLADYPLANVAAFDYFDVLTAGASDLLEYPSGDGSDNHPSSEGNQRASEAFVPWLEREVRRFHTVAARA